MSDREFLKLFSGLMGALIVLTGVLLVLANAVAVRNMPARPDAGAVAERIRPVGELTIGRAPAPGGGMSMIATANAAEADTGKTVFDSSCAACHATGVAGAPKIGDPGWQDRIAKGMPTLYQHAIEGFQGKAGYMPPKGGNAALSDAEVKAAVDYMVSQVK